MKILCKLWYHVILFIVIRVQGSQGIVWNRVLNAIFLSFLLHVIAVATFCHQISFAMIVQNITNLPSQVSKWQIPVQSLWKFCQNYGISVSIRLFIDWNNRVLVQYNSVDHTYGLVQDCSNSSALAMELLQSCTKPWMHHNNGNCRTETRLWTNTKTP